MAKRLEALAVAGLVIAGDTTDCPETRQTLEAALTGEKHAREVIYYARRLVAKLSIEGKASALQVARRQMQKPVRSAGCFSC